MGCTPAGSSVHGLLPAHGKLNFCVFQGSSASMSSAAVSALPTAPSGTAAEPRLSCSLGTSQNRAAQTLLCLLFGRHAFKSQSRAGGAGQGQERVSVDRASGREVLQRTPPDESPGHQHASFWRRTPSAVFPCWGRRWRSGARSRGQPRMADPAPGTRERARLTPHLSTEEAGARLIV